LNSIRQHGDEALNYTRLANDPAYGEENYEKKRFPKTDYQRKDADD